MSKCAIRHVSACRPCNHGSVTVTTQKVFFCAKSPFWREIESGRDAGEGYKLITNVGPVKNKEKERKREREREREGRKDQKIEVSAPM